MPPFSRSCEPAAKLLSESYLRNSHAFPGEFLEAVTFGQPAKTQSRLIKTTFILTFSLGALGAFLWPASI